MAARRVRAPGMWSPLVLLVVLVAVAAADADRVPRAAFGTAVGASRARQNQTQHTTPRPEPKSKPCQKNSDCETIRNTTCRMDSDNQRRCLCVDKAPPDNGRCPKPKYFVSLLVCLSLRWACNDNKECPPFAECATPNTTETNASTGRVCLCQPGHPETEDEECSGSSPGSGSLQLVALASVAALTLAATF